MTLRELPPAQREAMLRLFRHGPKPLEMQPGASSRMRDAIRALEVRGFVTVQRTVRKRGGYLSHVSVSESGEALRPEADVIATERMTEAAIRRRDQITDDALLANKADVLKYLKAAADPEGVRIWSEIMQLVNYWSQPED